MSKMQITQHTNRYGVKSWTDENGVNWYPAKDQSAILTFWGVVIVATLIAITVPVSIFLAQGGLR